MLAERPLSGELFAGVGGLERGVEEVFRTRAAFFAEIEKAPSRVLEVRYPGVPNLGDVTKIRWAESGFVGKIRVLSGGFPCTDVSLAGRQAGMSGTRSGLWSEYARAIDELRPDWVVIENVRGLLSTDAFGFVEQCDWCVGDDGGKPCLRALGAVLADLAVLGFDAEWVGLPASDIGAPHQRFRVFILAWPWERTVTHSGDRTGYGERARPQSREGSSSHLMPTPRASEGEKGGPNQRGSSGDLTMSSAVHRLLPTPGAYDGDRGGAQDPEKRRAGGHSVTIQDVAENLLPTPRTNDGNGTFPLSRPDSQDNLATRVHRHLAPTPTTSNQNGNQMNGRGELLLPGVAEASVSAWGKYQGAIDLWSEVVGRPAPAPVRMDGRGGKARLNPELTEWMMGWPLGWVTDAVLGLTRNEQLRACGNGVVPQQAAYALRILLSREGVPDIGWELVA